ncbi:MAG: DUF805 domain-containing protein [Acinetobacter sp.]|nr:DUF805 domain-containing protein [Acinetobacter sp.]
MNNKKSLFTYFKEAFTKNYANFKGRARRREYWGFFIFSLPITITANFATTKIGEIICFIILLAIFLPAISLEVRRLHDINKSGWFALYHFLTLIPVIGEWLSIIITITLGCISGTQGANRFGEDPLLENQNLSIAQPQSQTNNYNI